MSRPEIHCGGDWCPWCYVPLLPMSSAFPSRLDDTLELLRDEARDLASRGLGIGFDLKILAVLDRARDAFGDLVVTAHDEAILRTLDPDTREDDADGGAQ